MFNSVLDRVVDFWTVFSLNYFVLLECDERCFGRMTVAYKFKSSSLVESQVGTINGTERY
jgi:hypothetical protein